MRLARWLIALTLLAAPAAAVQTESLGVYPTGQLTSPRPWFTYRLNHESTATSSITIDNRSSSEQSVSVYAVDASPAAGGGLGMAPHSASPIDAGSWVHLATSVETIPARSSHDVAFRVRVPANASVGPHYAGIVVEPLHQIATSGGVQVIKRLGVRMYFTVPGAQHPGFKLSTPEPLWHNGELSVRVHIRNTGNVILTPSGTLTLRRPFSTSRYPMSIGELLRPGEERVMVIPTGKHHHILPFPYQATVRLTAGKVNASWSGKIWATNLFAAAFVGATLLVMLAGSYQRATYNRQRNRGQPKQS